MEKIYMIPVNDAYSERCGCPICRLRDKAENNYLEYYLGPSLMEPDTRKITNKTGFCPVHMGKLNKAVTNRLGLGLVMHTHLKDFDEDLNPKLKAAIPAKAGLIKGRSPEYKQKLNNVADLIEKRISLCPICDNLNLMSSLARACLSAITIPKESATAPSLIASPSRGTTPIFSIVMLPVLEL